jgi:hypothetical protein
VAPIPPFAENSSNILFGTTKNNEQGYIYSWGRGDDGQMGHGTTDNENIPRRIDALVQHKIFEVACGGSHCLAVDGMSFNSSSNLFPSNLNIHFD